MHLTIGYDYKLKSMHLLFEHAMSKKHLDTTYFL